MIETILTTVLSSTLLLKQPSNASNPQNPQITFTRVLPQKNYVSYVVEKNENLGDVALKYYGSADYWTNIWNDNSWITDPDDVEGKTLVINVNKADKSADLTPELAVRQDELNKKKNDAYLQTIGYKPVQQAVLPTVLPTATIVTPTQPAVSATPVISPTPVVTQQAVTTSGSPISEEAINALGSCEAGMDPTKNTGNGYYGAFQFSAGTWNSMNTGYARADLAPIEVQKAAVKQLIQRSSVYSQFPACAHRMHSTGLI